MSMCAPFMIRPPEDERTRRKPGEEEKRSPLKLAVTFAKQTVDSLWSSLTGRVKKQVEIHTAPLEERMVNARATDLTEEEIEVLLNDPNPLVRMELVHNDTISGDTLERLKRDPDFTVSTVARRKQMQLT